MAAVLFIKFFPLILIVVGLFPSVVWLLVYLREDAHPEPKKSILKIFLWGMLVAPFAVLLQYLALASLESSGVAGAAAIGLLGLAAIEEYLKYLVVKTEIEDEPVFNEPTDAVIYMIIAALGFAAVENISIAFSLAPTGQLQTLSANTGSFLNILKVLGVRLLGATLLHAFSSSIVGYALARRVFAKRGMWIIPLGLVGATLLHALFNYLILQSSEVRGVAFILAAATMTGAIIFIFKRVGRMQAS
ncbi:MAG: PrsW family glutamic-type intramembrane protease [bacterium]|nr:PrsW family glutamic-type intramembrane protease [bacterium]